MQVEFLTEGGEQGPVLLVDRTSAAEVLVVLGDFQHPLAGNVPPPEHVLEKREHVFRAIGPAERDEQHRVIRGRTFAFSVGWGRHHGEVERDPGRKLTPRGFEPRLPP